MLDRSEFENGAFTEEELIIIKRMLPSRFFSRAKNMSRSQFFRDVMRDKDGMKVVGSVRSTVYRMALSKRKLLGETDLPLSKRNLNLG